MDLPVLKSNCCDFEELLLNDGCTGIAAMATESPMEVQFDEHKLLVIYAANMQPFARVLREYGVVRDDKLKLITEGEHLHSTDETLPPANSTSFHTAPCRAPPSSASAAATGRSDTSQAP